MKYKMREAAVEKLGPGFRYRTGVYANGPVGEDGSLAGDLILVGRGDPNLMAPRDEAGQRPAFRELADRLQELGIREVCGDVIGDDSYFSPRGGDKGWTARELQTRYGAPVNALSINNNVVWVTARPSKYKEAVIAGIEPATSHFRIRNRAVTGSRKAKRTIRAPLPSTRTFRQHLVLENPAETAAAVFGEELERRGISVRGEVTSLHEGGGEAGPRGAWTLLAEHRSAPLVRALEIINKQSQNLHAEMLLRTLGAELRGRGTNEAGLEVVQEFLVEAAIDSDRIRLDDGCGLSRENLLTPRFQTSLLGFLLGRPYFGLFYDTLAVSGTDGTLKNRLSALEVKGSIHAKTGTLRDVTTLSGYITTRSGRNLVFSIFANRVTSTERVKRTIDEICSLLVKLY
jgi:D-alanyl-D-alanine carboxypeptidase/D-alanyl-D-alanine-endopeptidase (penicillin-binding protein 4)